MPQDRKTGAAWDRHLDDYDYAKELALSGWAWEYLRRNTMYQRDFRIHRAGRPVAIQHVSGARLYRLRRRFLAAEHWGLKLFADPSQTALGTDVFWCDCQLRGSVRCEARQPDSTQAETLALADIPARRAVLAEFQHEQIDIMARGLSLNLIVAHGSLLMGPASIRFFHDGIGSLSRHHEALRQLSQLLCSPVLRTGSVARPNTKYRDYLVALDGHIEGRSYRDIAEVLYGKERVGVYWTSDTQWMKSKVRRALEQGLALMNGGYRNLL